MAQPNSSDSSLQALERRVQEGQEHLLHKEEQLVARKNQFKAMVSEKLAAEEQYVAQYNVMATE